MPGCVRVLSAAPLGASARMWAVGPAMGRGRGWGRAGPGRIQEDHSMAESDAGSAAEVAVALAEAAGGGTESDEGPRAKRRIVAVALLLAMTVASLEQTVVSTAMPSIIA